MQARSDTRVHTHTLMSSEWGPHKAGVTTIPILQARTLEAQRGQVTYQRSHSYHVVPPGSKPKAVQ